MAPATQGNLFGISTSRADPEGIGPFALQRSSFRFHTWPDSRNTSKPVILFVFDAEVPLLLYIGQVVKVSPPVWSTGLKSGN